MAPGEPAIELVADFYIALAAVDSAAALSGARSAGGNTLAMTLRRLVRGCGSIGSVVTVMGVLRKSGRRRFCRADDVERGRVSGSDQAQRIARQQHAQRETRQLVDPIRNTPRK